MSSKSRLWQFLSNKGQATNSEIAEFFRGSKGQLSWSQRLREIRKDLIAKGGDLTCKELKQGIYLYKVIMPEPPPTEHEEIIIRENLARETVVNLKQINKQYAFL
jgi:hypothetical protein